MDDFLTASDRAKMRALGYRRHVVRDGKDSEPVTPTMTAEAFVLPTDAGYPQESASNQESVAYLMRTHLDCQISITTIGTMGLWPCTSMAAEPGRTGTRPCVRY